MDEHFSEELFILSLTLFIALQEYELYLFSALKFCILVIWIEVFLSSIFSNFITKVHIPILKSYLKRILAKIICLIVINPSLQQ